LTARTGDKTVTKGSFSIAHFTSSICTSFEVSSVPFSIAPSLQLGKKNFSKKFSLRDMSKVRDISD